MRSREPRLIVSFHTTAEAMATERLCQRHGLEGKLVSVPRQITSDCGIAWSSPLALWEDLENLLQTNQVEFAGFHKI